MEYDLLQLLTKNMGHLKGKVHIQVPPPFIVNVTDKLTCRDELQRMDEILTRSSTERPEEKRKFPNYGTGNISYVIPRKPTRKKK